MRKRRTSAPSRHPDSRAAGSRRLFRVPGTTEATLQAQLEEGTPATEPAALLLGLEAEGRFHRDRGWGRIFHLRGVSLRECRPADSLHISVYDNRLTAHVDHVSPLGTDGEDTPSYSFRRAVAHNLAGMSHDLGRLLRGRQGDHRSQLNCQWVWEPGQSSPREEDLLDPRASAWSVQVEVRVAGRLDAGRLRSALGTALGVRDHPVAVVPDADEQALEAARRRLQTEIVRPDERPPLRAALVHHSHGDVLMLNLNHAAADAFAALRVLDCVAGAYAGGTAPDPPLDFLSTRSAPVRPASAPVPRWMRSTRSAVEGIRDALARPARLAAEGDADEPGYGFHLVRLDEDKTAGLTSNALLAALHLAIGQWNLDHRSPGRHVGVLVPVNLRPVEWPEATIGNFSVTTRVSTARRHRSGPASALQAVSSQTKKNKRTRTGVALIAALDRTGLLPVWAKQSLVVLQPLTANHDVDTAMLAHLGRVEEAPAFGHDAGESLELWFSVPARAPLALCVGAVSVAGRLHLTFRYPHRLFGAEAARRFAECYVDHLRHVAGDPALERQVQATASG